MRQAILTIVFALLIVSCTGLSDKATKSEFVYPPEIDSLEMREQYDQAKWVLYCFNCDDTCKFFKETGIEDTITLGRLDLKFERYRKVSDTVDLEFNFYYHDTLKCDERVCRTRSLTGLAYKVSAKEYFALIDTRWGNYFWKPSYNRSRLYNPLQPEVVEYIKANRDRLNLWFLEEAQRRGVLQVEK